MSAQTDKTANADHVRWLAETWKMIERCAASLNQSERVSLSTAGCAAIRDERDRLRSLNAELLAMVELAVQTCSVCRGNGKLSDTHNWGACPACADLRALIARAKDAL